MNHLDFNDVIHSLNLDSLVYPKNITAETILQYVRAMANTVGSNVETLYKLMDDRVEALEFIISPKATITGICLQDMRFKKGLLIAGIMRKGKFIIPGGQDVFQVGDAVIVVTTNSGFQDVYDILEE